MMEDGKIPGALHLYVGEEAVASGVMVHLSNQDQITSTHRGHGHLIAKGGEFDRCSPSCSAAPPATARARAAACTSPTWSSACSAPTASSAAVRLSRWAPRSPTSSQDRQRGLCFFGDGASNEGSFHEAANMAALYKLPACSSAKTTATANTPRRPTTRRSSTSRTARRATACPASWSTAWTSSRCTKRRAKPSPAPGPVKARPCSSARPTATTTTSACAAWA